MKLPLPDSISQAHSDKLSSLIRKEIQEREFISFSRFMELALYAPGLGYYSAGLPKLGTRGDFITAPEISPLFAKCLARQCQPILETLHHGTILELGAGTGVLARDLLLELEQLNSLPSQYFILEVSADLRERQQVLLKAALPHLFSKIIWLDTLPVTPIGGIILANEVLDALPIHCFQIEGQIPLERCVTWENKQFTWKITAPTTPDLITQLELIQQECPLQDGYASEINLILPAWLRAIANSLNQGILLFFDYGYGQREYYHPDRRQGTLMCYYQHHKHSNPFTHIGLQDVTAHVNFTHVIESAIQAGLSLGGYTTQSSFLLACGLPELVAAQHLTHEAEIFKQNQAIKLLTLPSQMGEAIKVMALTKDFEMPLLGFSFHERSRDL